MQFQNLPVRRMIDGGGGPMAYADSTMRKYLVKVSSSPEDAEAEGNFTKGLILAGVPMDTDIIWAPNREISNTAQDAVDTIKDNLWIATEREMWGVGMYSNMTLENRSNQAFLEYYLERGTMLKYVPTNTSGFDAWLASPAAGDSKKCCTLLSSANPEARELTSSGGIAPAFCVK
jgi:hypothetical protein